MTTPIMDRSMPGQHRQRRAPGTLSFEHVPPPTSAMPAEIAAHLNALGHVAPWSPAKDLVLVEVLRSGLSLDQATAALPGVTRSQALRRWNVLMMDGSFETQTRTHAELKRRAKDLGQ